MSRIGIISGSGILPQLVADAARSVGIKPYMILLKGSAEKHLEKNPDHQWSNVTAVGKILAYFREYDVRRIILVGGMERPPLLSLIPDLTGAKLLSRILKLDKTGDDSLLKEIIKFLEEEHFQVIGIQDIAPDILTPKNILTKKVPNDRQNSDINYGYEVALNIGKLDIGQSVIVQDGEILGLEAAEGTSELIKRCAKLQRGGKGGILIKICKPSQDKRIDLPTIGIHTIEKLSSLGYAGVVLSSGDSIILNKEDVVELADKHKMFIKGI